MSCEDQAFRCPKCDGPIAANDGGEEGAEVGPQVIGEIERLPRQEARCSDCGLCGHQMQRLAITLLLPDHLRNRHFFLKEFLSRKARNKPGIWKNDCDRPLNWKLTMPRGTTGVNARSRRIR